MATVEFFLSNDVLDAECVCVYPTLSDVPYKYIKSCNLDNLSDGKVYLYLSGEKCPEDNCASCLSEDACEPCQDAKDSEELKVMDYLRTKFPTIFCERVIDVFVNYKDKNIILDMLEAEYVQPYKVSVKAKGDPMFLPGFYCNPYLTFIENKVKKDIGYSVFLSCELPEEYVDKCEYLTYLDVPVVSVSKVGKK